jgi:hypothetical protein
VEKLEAEKRLLDAKREQVVAERYRPRYVYGAPVWSGFDGGGPAPIYGPTIIRRGPLAGPVYVSPDFSRAYMQSTR